MKTKLEEKDIEVKEFEKSIEKLVKKHELKTFCKFYGKEIEQSADNYVQCSTTLRKKD